MKSLGFAAALLLAITSSGHAQTPAVDVAQVTPVTIEYYYRLKWGSAGEFKTLYNLNRHFSVYLDVVNVFMNPDREREFGYGEHEQPAHYSGRDHRTGGHQADPDLHRGDGQPGERCADGRCTDGRRKDHGGQFRRRQLCQ